LPVAAVTPKIGFHFSARRARTIGVMADLIHGFQCLSQR
jgi:hypothetical protein